MKIEPIGTEAPDLSVVVALIAGGQEPVRNCLDSLKSTVNGVRMQCIVPYDDRLPAVDELRVQFPWALFVDARNDVKRFRLSHFSREHHDILRSAGLRLADGNVVALIEDHAVPGSRWLQTVVDSHRKQPDAAIGGAVENGVDRLLNWAVYYCDFGRYQNPVSTGCVEFASDSNIAYKRRALEKTRHLWSNVFNETTVNWELVRLGQTLRLNPDQVVFQTRTDLSFVPALIERFVWGRSFAASRVAEASFGKRWIRAASCLPLPVLLTWRVFRTALSKGRHLDRLVMAMPLVFLLEIIWSFGEFAGYVTGKAD